MIDSTRFLSRRSVPLVVAVAALPGAVPAAATVVSTPGGGATVAGFWGLHAGDV